MTHLIYLLTGIYVKIVENYSLYRECTLDFQ